MSVLPAQPCSESTMHGNAIGRRLGARVNAVVPNHARDAQPVRREDSAAALFLRLAVLLHVAPLRDARLVAPELQRHELAGRGDALEALEGYETVGLVQFRLELADQLHVVREAAGGRGEFEDDGDHGRLAGYAVLPTIL